jgi:hypothetical protein
MRLLLTFFATSSRIREKLILDPVISHKKGLASGSRIRIWYTCDQSSLAQMRNLLDTKYLIQICTGIGPQYLDILCKTFLVVLSFYT